MTNTNTTETWLSFMTRIGSEHGEEGKKGAMLASKDISAEGWTVELAQRYLASVAGKVSQPRAFGIGYDSAVRWFVSVAS